jgi:hypothetical protein
MNMKRINSSIVLQFDYWPDLYLIRFYLFNYVFQVDVWALGVSAIEMAEVYPLHMFSIQCLISELLVYLMASIVVLFFPPFLLPTSLRYFAFDL